MGLKEGVVWAAEWGRNMEKKRSERVSFLCSRLALATVAVAACSDGVRPSGRGGGGGEAELTALCEELQMGLTSVLPKDAIPALSNPNFVSPDHRYADYLLPSDRVIGIEIDGEYLAFPHNVLWWHEIVNMNELGLAVTYCPFTGSSMVFHRQNIGGDEFGVSGFLFKNNLVMYDRVGPNSDIEETLWPQMLAEGRCGTSERDRLKMYPALEIEWADWVALHPDTRVVSGETGLGRGGRAYTLYPYGDYEVEDNIATLQPLEEFDDRRPPKERVLGIPYKDGGGIAFPFGALRSVGDLAAIHATAGSADEASALSLPIVVFWDSEAAAAVAYGTTIAGQALTFEVRDGAFVDLETGSQWSIAGEALSGPFVGESLDKIADAYVSFWFAFSQFYPNPVLWLP